MAGTSAGSGPEINLKETVTNWKAIIHPGRRERGIQHGDFRTLAAMAASRARNACTAGGWLIDCSAYVAGERS